MNTCKLATKRTAGLVILLLLVLLLGGCGKAEVNPAPTDNLVEDTPAPLHSTSGLTARLEIPKQLTTRDEVNLKFTLTNISERPMYVLKWYTPLEGIAGKIFRVTRDGQMVPFDGILASRAAPSLDAYVFLAAGASVSAVVDLSTSFDFSKAGTYEIQFISPRISHIALSEAEMATSVDDLRPVEIPSHPVTVLIGE
ncbi:MAG: hypothetical protein P8046_06175 [Anaerolineales bacterium]